MCADMHRDVPFTPRSPAQRATKPALRVLVGQSRQGPAPVPLMRVVQQPGGPHQGQGGGGDLELQLQLGYLGGGLEVEGGEMRRLD
jgi:hypothetical protein